MDDNDVLPDDSLLGHIFGRDQPLSVSRIMLHDEEKCVFQVDFEAPALFHGRQSCVVRIEAQDTGIKPTHFALVAAIQEIAATCIPGLVAKTLRVGTASNDEGREFQFCIMELIEGVTLDEAWEQMTADNKASVVAAVVDAVSKLSTVRLSDAKVQDTLRRALGNDNAEEFKEIERAVYGGPDTGFMRGRLSLLNAIYQRYRLPDWTFYTTRPLDLTAGVEVTSNFRDLDTVSVTDPDMEQWAREAVLCHNDLTPRNLILSASQDPDGHTKYMLAGIIDWELAGFYPATLELALQDTYLGCNNHHYTFYRFLRQGMLGLVPKSISRLILLRAFVIIFESQQRALLENNNIGARIRQRYRERLDLVRNYDPFVGWTCTAVDNPLPEVSARDYERIIDEAIEEARVKRRAERGFAFI